MPTSHMRDVFLEVGKLQYPTYTSLHLNLKIFQCAMHFYKMTPGHRNIPEAIGFAKCA